MKLNQVISLLTDYTGKIIKVVNNDDKLYQEFSDIGDIILLYDYEVICNTTVIAVNIFKNEIEIVTN